MTMAKKMHKKTFKCYFFFHFKKFINIKKAKNTNNKFLCEIKISYFLHFLGVKTVFCKLKEI